MRLTALLPGVLLRYLGRLRFPTLFAITACLFVLDLILPDGIPLADELLLGLATALLASWKDERADPGGTEEIGERPDSRTG